ncbi:MAG: hypothetical protein JOY68_06160 [Candidatus Dormibacteraeota bacterium]|nr:hypothetical protein [Candidatus Dormibacteraeota bacterium]
MTVWELVHDVTAGTPYAAADVAQVQIHATADDFSYESAGPLQLAARYATNLNAHDIVRSDDLIPDSAQSEVAITAVDPPPVNPGDSVDVYATLPSGVNALIGRSVIVESVDGGSLTVLVPTADEASWITVSASSVALHIARTVPGAQLAPSPLGSSDAIRILCGAPCAGALPVAAPSP